MSSGETKYCDFHLGRTAAAGGETVYINNGKNRKWRCLECKRRNDQREAKQGAPGAP